VPKIIVKKESIKDTNIKSKNSNLTKENTEAVSLSSAIKEKVGNNLVIKRSSFDSPKSTSEQPGDENEELSNKSHDEESNSDESIDAEKNFFLSEIHKDKELTKAETGRTYVQGKKKRVYETLGEPELSMMTDFIYTDVWRRMKKLNHTASGDCARDVLKHVGITDDKETHFRFQDTLALIKECLANRRAYSIRKLRNKMKGMSSKIAFF
jgi:hypothetical protein